MYALPLFVPAGCGYHCSESPVQPNSSMIPLGSQTRKQGAGVLEPGRVIELLKETTLSLVSGAVCHVIGLGVIPWPVSSL